MVSKVQSTQNPDVEPSHAIEMVEDDIEILLHDSNEEIE